MSFCDRAVWLHWNKIKSTYLALISIKHITSRQGLKPLYQVKCWGYYSVNASSINSMYFFHDTNLPDEFMGVRRVWPHLQIHSKDGLTPGFLPTSQVFWWWCVNSCHPRLDWTFQVPDCNCSGPTRLDFYLTLGSPAFTWVTGSTHMSTGPYLSPYWKVSRKCILIPVF